MGVPVSFGHDRETSVVGGEWYFMLVWRLNARSNSVVALANR